MAVTALALVRLRNLFAVVMLAGVFSLLAAVLYVVLDAVDVAFTEAAEGLINGDMDRRVTAVEGAADGPAEHGA